ncbi:uncharacterized protein LOC135824744 [Sycon ciliatum]|uniref:uncharacterized protein LOC135824744 n=1 Tax=Sycon ciliatum TaxID=27933 RepID=UPI0031F7107A
MGWSSWNHYHRKYNESVFYANAKAMASNGMKDVGYEYINIDGGWWAGADTGHAQRNATGFMQVNAEKFPNGIPKLVDYVHSLGLKWGHYTDAGSHFCNRDEPASYGYEEQDAKLFVSFGADMVKIDACGSTTEQHEPTMAKWARLFNESGRPVLVSNCHNGCQTNAWFDWCPQSANMWRSSSDINDSWKSIMSNLHTLVERGAYGGPGRWNDPDFLEVGNSGLSHDEAVAHFSLWCVTSSPLIAGNDLTSMDAATLAIYTNKVAISVNQRYLNSSGDRVMVNGTLEVWAKPLPDNEYGVVLLNAGDETESITFPLSKLGIASRTTCQQYDIWTQASGPVPDGILNSGPLAKHSAKFYVISKC